MCQTLDKGKEDSWSDDGNPWHASRRLLASIINSSLISQTSQMGRKKTGTKKKIFWKTTK